MHHNTISFSEQERFILITTDQSTSKKRPAVIISSTPYNQRGPDVVIMAVTSQIHRSGYFGDIPIQEW
ncbi:type II toxin-antitoxin system PemK/MazF family toxin [Desulfobacter postgatei]|uniref:type II toxin-antitoxin system PemK/MazF family toxin n=1 Tax=Desulfobacter postgatei TaxID=2293 RepID=UPI000232B0E2|nr:type II toxin-antitoxin system PemK/MazF family toxin [Desulfobacter postgatei]